MGAFHEGHLDLMREARKAKDLVVVSLFVNPTQFGKNEDFDSYPRDFERDREMAEGVGVDILFAPPVDEIYPGSSHLGEGTTIHVPEVTERWEGAVRPGHFDGVATVVAKLFNIVRPGVAYFGQKDLQQCAVVQRMVRDLNIPLKIEVIRTRREPDGLAMSSRNAYLSPSNRAIAPALYREITSVASVLQGEDQAGTEVDAVLSQARDNLASSGFSVDYVEWVDAGSLAPIRSKSPQSAIIAAARLGKTRLIDNVVF